VTMPNCLTCGSHFNLSYSNKKFCSKKCYFSSDLLKSIIRERAIAQSTSLTKLCPECGKEYKTKKSRDSVTCSRACYRRFFAKRFDRFILSRSDIGSINNFDEFMTQNELPCLIKGCSWVGKSLSLHINSAHGITARDFKDMAGFNRRTGLVCEELSERLSLHDRDWFKKFHGPGNAVRGAVGYKWTDEHREHRAKARAISLKRLKTCVQCGTEFATKATNVRFCSIVCRDTARAARAREVGPCSVCNNNFSMSRLQAGKVKKGLPVVCGFACRKVAIARRRQQETNDAQRMNQGGGGL